MYLEFKIHPLIADPDLAGVPRAREREEEVLLGEFRGTRPDAKRLTDAAPLAARHGEREGAAAAPGQLLVR